MVLKVFPSGLFYDFPRAYPTFYDASTGLRWRCFLFTFSDFPSCMKLPQSGPLRLIFSVQKTGQKEALSSRVRPPRFFF